MATVFQWQPGQQVIRIEPRQMLADRMDRVVIERVTPSGRAVIGDQQYNTDGTLRGGGSRQRIRPEDPWDEVLLAAQAEVEAREVLASNISNRAYRASAWTVLSSNRLRQILAWLDEAPK